jgi:hypothetical protein
MHIGVPQKYLPEIEFLLRLYFNKRDFTFSPDWQRIHVLTHPVNVHDHNHIVFARH